MTCYHPRRGYYSKTVNETGKRSLVWTTRDAYRLTIDEPVYVPCNKCVGCRLNHSKQWAIRCVHEAQLHDRNAFITLTYHDDHLPEGNTLDHGHWQKFMKRFRKHLEPKRIRFFMCGEYGDKFGRPHYHACIFNHQFGDLKFWKITNGVPLYTSAELSQLWPWGYSSVGAVTFASAAYVARYIMKKITGPPAESHYEWIHPKTGEIFQRKPEYTKMSTSPGLGKDWIHKFTSDIYPNDFVAIKGKILKPPKYYDKQYEILYPNDFLDLQASRRHLARQRGADNTTARLAIREQVATAKIRSLPRDLK